MKKALSLLLSIVLALSSFPAAMAATFTDEAKWPANVSWAKEEIAYMTDKGILNGYAEDGTFRPADSVTRAQFIKMIVETFGLTATAAINYSDVKSGYWYYDYISKAAAQGFLLNYGSALNPDGALSRQEAAALLARYLDLDPSQKVSASTYVDYNSINANYREYVLQASYVGLFQGDEDGKFSPDRILRRCEAAAILYRAAGTIYRASASGIDAAASNENAVISKSGVTVSNAVIKGDLLITEGAASGTVTLSGCTVDRVILRGSASVILADCHVTELVVDSSVNGYTTPVTLTGSGKVTTFTATTPVSVEMSARSEIGVLTVKDTAKNSSVSGTGKVSSARINASGFTAAAMPVKYTLAVGLTATLAGKTYNGTGVEAGTTGFSKAPTSYATTASCYLTATPNVTGSLYYYFTNEPTAPTAVTFDSLYASASVKSYISTVSANAPIDQTIGATASVSSYTYIAVMIRGYEPVILVNAASDGFSVDPIVTIGDNDETLHFTSATDGILYFYYTSSSAVPTTTTFQNNFNSNSYYYKGTLNAEANKATSVVTMSASSVTAYPYVVVSLRDASGNQYQPVVIEKGVAEQNGFTTAPYCQLSSSHLVLSYTPGVSGKVDYYFTTLSTVPTPAQFTTNLLSATANTFGTLNATKGAAYFDALPNQTAAAKYSYIALRLTDENGTIYQPVVVSIPAGAGVNLTGSGLSAVPTTSITAGYIYMTAQTNAAGEMYFYLTNNATAPSASAFLYNYEANVTGSGLATKNGGMMTLAMGTNTFTTGLTTEAVDDFEFIALMLKIGTTNMSPIVIPLPDTQSTVNKQEATGFVTNPTYKKANVGTHEISFSTNVSGKIYFYYTDDPSVPESTVAYTNAITEIRNYNNYAGTATAVKNYPSSFIVPITAYVPAYVVMMIVDDNGTYYQPIIIQADPEASAASAAGFKVAPTVTVSGGYANLTYQPAGTGTLYYYFSKDTTVPTNSQFMMNWGTVTGTSMGGSFQVTAASSAKSIAVPAGYTHLIMMLLDSASGNYRAPIVLPLSGTAGTTPTVPSGTTGFSGTPAMYNGSLMFNATTTGTLYYYFTSESSFSLSGTMTGAFSGTKLITSTGIQQITLVDTGMWAYISTLYKYVMLCMSTPSGGMLTPVTVSLTGGTVPGTVPGTIPGTSTDTDGFSSNPVKANNSYVTFVPSSTGTVKYFFINADTQYDATSFTTTHSYYASNGAGGSVNVFANDFGSIALTGYTSYKYVWIQLGTNTPVRVQLS